MPAFVCSHLGFVWPDGDVVFTDLDLTFPNGLTGLVGATARASTLLRILTGDSPTSGSRPPLVGYLPQQLTLHVDRPARVLGSPTGWRLARTEAGGQVPTTWTSTATDLPGAHPGALAELGRPTSISTPGRHTPGGQVVLTALAGLSSPGRTRWSWTSRRTTSTPAGLWPRPYAAGPVRSSWSATTASCWIWSTRSSRSASDPPASTAEP